MQRERGGGGERDAYAHTVVYIKIKVMSNELSVGYFQISYNYKSH